MGAIEKYIEEIEAYEKILIEDLTVNEALILVAVCAAKEKNIDKNHIHETKRIEALAKDHPIFKDLHDSIKPSLNKFMNTIKSKDTVKYVMAAAKVLKPELKETAFTWTVTILMSDGVLTKARKDILDKYAMILNIDGSIAQKILVQASQAS
jgi:hypothetical protein